MIHKVKVLQGHVDPETAYVVDDYPYGRTLRCKIRFWIDTATKGAAKDEQRFARQTTNPKVSGEVWNKPHYSTYSILAVLYLDENDHVQWWGTGVWVSPEADARMRLMGIYGQLDERQRKIYNVLLGMSKKNNAEGFQRFERIVDMLADHIRRTGSDPELPNGTYTEDSGQTHWVGDEYIRPTFLTLARERAAVG